MASAGDRRDVLARWESTQGSAPTPSPDATYKRTSPASSPAGNEPTFISAPAVAAPSIPRELRAEGGTYQLLDVLGQGGMGVVVRAIQPGLGREVAIKRSIAPPGPARAQFLAESLITSRLDHPNIIPVYDLIATPEGETALAMKRVRGTSWRDLLHPAQPSDRRDLEFHLGVLMSVANAVAFAHSRHVVHADLKPENVMVGEFGEVVLMDWGVAVDVATPPDPRSPIPHRSTVQSPFGTPSYMPPELAFGDGEAVGPWTDTYLLGAILYEIVDGSPPHRGGDLRATLEHAGSGKITPLSTTVPESLRRLIERALAPEPSRRFPDAAAFREALGGYLRSRESLALTAQAQQILEQAGSDPTYVAQTEGPRSYLRLAEAGAGFRQAMVLWPDNPEAKQGAQEASVALVEQALAHGDLGLASSEVKRIKGTARYTPLSASIASALDERTRQERSAATAKNAVKALTVLVIAILGGGLFLVRSEARLAEARLQTVRRLADVKHLADYRAEAERLWPARPDRVPALEEWVQKARRLVEGIDGHRATLAELRAEAAALPDGGFQFASDTDQWQHDTLAALLQDLQSFAAHDLPAVEQRLAFATTVKERSLVAHRTEWDAAIAAIGDRAAHPLYQGLVLAPQLGLVPLGEDPASGLWEFAHLESGDVPARGADGRLNIDEKTGVVLVLVPPGRFEMGVEPVGPSHPLGSPNVDPSARPAEGPVRAVQLGPFFMSKYEMTQGQWLRATGTNPSAYQAGQVIGGKTLTPRNPVEQITWQDAVQVLGNWGLDLPTEAQWEYAARAGTTTVYWEGSNVEDLRGAANLADRYCRTHGGPASWVYEDALDDGWVTHAPVGLFRANPFGLHDMQGNVWEWCQDKYGGYDLPVAPGTGERIVPGDQPRVFRGGGFRSSAVHARSGDRYSLYYSGSRAFDVGVRPARSVDP